MNQKLAIAVVVVIAIVAGGYLWYTNQPSVVPPQVSDTTEEPAVTGTPSATVIANSIEGTWRSSDDARFTRSFGAGGKVTDRYAGNDDATVTGHFELDGDHVPAQVRAAAGASPVLSVEFPEEALFFIVTKLTADELELVYLGGNGTLRFERI
jgi:hypothetical protein